MLTVGASIIVFPEASISSPMACPTLFSRSMSNAAPRAMATGKAVEKSFLPSPFAFRFTPRGPSRKYQPRMPRVELSSWLKTL
jgi:hypothetical protein